MTGTRFDIVDVFAQEKYAGNQLAVVHDVTASTDEMHRIAREFNFSETTFVDPGGDPDKGFDVRIFSPGGELPFAGHPTLGTAAVLMRALDGAVDEVVLEERVGAIPVTVEAGDDGEELLYMRQRDPRTIDTVEPNVAADAVSVAVDDLDGRYPPEIVTTGVPTLIVPLAARDAVGRAATGRETYDRLVEELDLRNLLVFAPDPIDADNDLHVRVFADYLGIPEDPATGSSNGCLAAYLATHRYFGTPDVEARVEQGHEVGRPSLLHLRAADRGDGGVDVEVGGEVVHSATGRLI